MFNVRSKVRSPEVIERKIFPIFHHFDNSHLQTLWYAKFRVASCNSRGVIAKIPEGGTKKGPQPMASEGCVPKCTSLGRHTGVDLDISSGVIGYQTLGVRHLFRVCTKHPNENTCTDVISQHPFQCHTIVVLRQNVPRKGASVMSC